MMASRFSRLFRLWLLASLKTSPNRLHFVSLFSKLFCLCKFVLPVSLFLPLQVCASFFLESSPTSVQDCFRWSLISRLRLVSLVLFLALVHIFFSSVLLVSKSCELLGRARLGFCISFDFSFFLVNPAYLHGSWSLLCFAHRE